MVSEEALLTADEVEKKLKEGGFKKGEIKDIMSEDSLNTADEVEKKIRGEN